MRITCISDTHMHHKKIKMPETDMIIHTGDFTYHGEFDEVKKFLQWYGEQNAKYKLLVCGNHEVEISKQPFQLLQSMCEDQGIQLLYNSHTIIQGLTIFGSPYTPQYGNWAYMKPDHLLTDIYNSILQNVDILITHGPPLGILDRNMTGHYCGSNSLKNKVEELNNLKLHVFGHIHESRGTRLYNGKLFVNAAICGIPYTDVVINPITVEI